MAVILFRMGRFDRAERAFARVLEYSPNLVTEYEAKLYRASCLIRLDRTTEAERILNRLENDGKFEE
jgi:tetratricopeptide (TPR) repeat protein